ncbi:MAG: DNA polymerase III subunit gamma/tau [Firmicutes bacterium]|nr:DNA polymerase III subunit gamma/tau [Bacillota bacterium]MDD4263314.1 DNA polymerase III subunit gamma/tau [Bacillota bacterium]MDD4693785.1 DNA polymerase III subunit gamma/tau [Bacillota bacterium]
MARLSLYRKWRPQGFESVVGQDHVIKTLQNAIETSRIVHAYLFAGPRGTGKTSTARLLAKALNCEKGPTTQPCDECESCVAIREGRSLDVFEIDGASNRGIDEIRQLRETVRFKATQGKYKIYIIDEIHMLTIEAFNALLKTLEEPPENVVFVFATTEPQKVPATILSRCQRFTFRRIPTEVIVDRLVEISEKEGVKVEEGALHIIAETSQGGMRDALSLLDQAMAFSKDVVTSKIVQEMLGLTDAEALTSFFTILANQDLKGGLELIRSALFGGKDLIYFMESAMQVARSLLVVNADKTAPLQPGEILLSRDRKDFLQIVKTLDSVYLVKIIETLAEAVQKGKQTADPELFFDLALVTLIEDKEKSNEIESLRSLVEDQNKKLTELEKKIGEGKSQVKQKYDVVTYWKEMLEKLKSKKDTLEFYAFLVVAQPVAFDGHNLYINFPETYEFHRANVVNPKNKSLIEAKLGELTGSTIKLHVDKTPGAKKDPDFLAKTQDVFGGTILKPE